MSHPNEVDQKLLPLGAFVIIHTTGNIVTEWYSLGSIELTKVVRVTNVPFGAFVSTYTTTNIVTDWSRWEFGIERFLTDSTMVAALYQ